MPNIAAALLQSPRLRRVGLIAGAIALVWTAGAGWLLPRWLKPQIETAATQALATPVRLDALSISPWTLTARLGGLRVGPAQAEFVKLKQLEARVSLQSLWRLAPVVSRVTLVEPQVFIERTGEQRFNFSTVLDHLNAQPKQPDSEPAKFAVHNIRINGGRIRYLDHVIDPAHPEDHLISDLNVGVPFLSNLPSDVEVDVRPLLEAKVDGSLLRVTGTTQPFDKDLHSSIDINWSAVDLAYWARAARPLLPPELRADVARGQLDTQLHIAFEQRPAPAVSTLKIGGQVQVSSLDVKWPQQALAWRWQTLNVSGIDARPLERQASVERITLTGLGVDAGPFPAPAAPPATPHKPAASRTQPVASAASAAAPAATASSDWAWHIGQIDVAASAIQVEPQTGQKLPAIGPLKLSLAGLDSRAQAAPAKLQFSAADANQGTVKLGGSVQLAQRQAALDLAVEQLQPGPWLAPFASALPATVSAGTVALRAHLQVEPQAATLTQGQLDLAGIQAQSTTPPKGVTADRLTLPKLSAGSLQAALKLGEAGASLDHAKLDALRIEQLDATLTRSADGRWLWAPAPAAAASTSPAKPEKSAKAAPLPRIELGELRCSACNFNVTDHTTAQASNYSLLKSDIKLTSLSSDLGHTSQFEISGVGQHSGTLLLSGEVRPEPLKLQSKVLIKNVDLRGLQPYVDPYLNLTLNSIKVQADGTVALETGAGGDLAARYKGRVGVTELRTQDRVNSAEFLRWKTFSLDGLNAEWKQNTLTADFGQIALRDFYARLILNPDGTLNVAQVLRAKGAEAQSITTPNASNAPGQKPAVAPQAAPSNAPAGAASAPADANKLPPNLRWAGITLANGRIDFTDTFIKPNYSARLTQINGTVSGVSSNKPEPADLKITGKVDDAAPLDISGRIHPLGARLTTDITAAAKGIEMTRFSPYAARYAGYAIEKGTLSVNVNYKVNNGQLEANNNIYLDQLTFGEKVDSPDATKLPVLFAVSLLKDRNGVIDVNLPISGSIDDPDFSVGGIIVRVIVNLLTKAVTAPFSLLAGLGGGDQELGFVAFAPGSARLEDDATKRLDTLARLLTDRPALKLEITGHADPSFDVDGLKKRYVMRLMRQAKAKATGAEAADVSIADDEHDRWLEAAYKAADVKKPRNVVGLAKSLPPAEMQAILEASAPADADALLQLANRRADAVKAYLANKLPPERVQLTASKATTAGITDKGPTTRAQFAMH
jgi:uncharacterized protein involved in outer membrane biogenesis